MLFDSAKNLKLSLMGESLAAPVRPAGALPLAATAVTATARVAKRPRYPFAIGVVGSGQKYRLAIRVQSATPGVEQAIEYVRHRARGECEVQVVGRVVKQQPWHRRRNRPLQIGGSIGHVQITAGTLGCFVSDRTLGEEFILSNNHVLANENDAKAGDNIIQPGDADGGRVSLSKVGELVNFIPLRRRGNAIDAATASIAGDMEYYYNWLEGRGAISGVRDDLPEEGEIVYKVGRTTGLTRGRISAIEVDGLLVGYDMGDAEFEGQIQIVPADNKPFSLAGDSGSLIVDRYRRALALLFAGNDVDSTFASPIRTVLDALQVELVY